MVKLIFVRDKNWKKKSIFLGQFKNIKEAKNYWCQGNNLLKQMVKNKEVIFFTK
jgi:hypothetical protein